VLSGGIEGPSHGPGPCAHCRGYSVDLRSPSNTSCVGNAVAGSPVKDACLKRTSGVCQCSAPAYFTSQTCTYSIDETRAVPAGCSPPHWHLQFENCLDNERCGAKKKR